MSRSITTEPRIVAHYQCPNCGHKLGDDPPMQATPDIVPQHGDRLLDTAPRLCALVSELAKIVGPQDVVLVGSAPMAVRSIRDVGDLDVLVHGAAMTRLRMVLEIHAGLKVTMADENLMAIGVDVGMMQLSSRIVHFANATDLTELELFEESIHFDIPCASQGRSLRWAVMSLGHCRRIKRARGQMKDLEDLRSIGDYLRRSNEVID